MSGVAVLVLILTLILTACNDTHNQRCNDLLTRQNVDIGNQGWTLRCDPTASDLAYNPPSWVQGYADPIKHVVALWPDRISSDPLLRKTADHELGHIIGMKRGVDSEWWADGFAWCYEQIPGVGYFNMPSNCTPYRL